jgi:chemotaxis protein methyltransferase CheR
VPAALWPRLSEFVAEQTGLHFPPERRADLQRALLGAAAEFGFADSASCVEWLLSTPLTRPQLHLLASHLTIGETYFFRESQTFDALAQHILPALIQRRRGRDQRLRLWSAACSTGEEAYSLAILVQRLLPDWPDWHVKILATDINERFLQRAAAGVYGPWSFRQSPAGFQEQYFTHTADGRFAVTPQIRDGVSFAQLNLAGDSFPSLATDTNAMDVILCRNVLIYFTPGHARKLVDNLRHALLEDAWLAVSPSECSQALFSGFAAVNFPGSILYRKCHGEPAKAATWTAMPAGMTASTTAPVFEAPPRSTAIATEAVTEEVATVLADTASDLAGTPDPLEVAESLYAEGRYAEAAATLLDAVEVTGQWAPASVRGGRGPRTFSLLTRALANQGQLADALAWSERWIAADKVDCAAHYIHAMILEEQGEREAARRSLHRAVYLQPEFALAHFALGNLARADGRGEAKKHFENALHLLRTRNPNEPLPESDGMGAGRLMEIIATVLTLPDRPAVLPS